MTEKKRLNSTLSKEELRKIFRQNEKNFATSSAFAATEEELQLRLLEVISKKSGTWGAFFPLFGEPDLIPVLKKNLQIHWVFPKALSKTAMGWSSWDFSSSLVPNLWGGQESPSPVEEVRKHLQGVLVPALAYDQRGTRLGRGAGCYDRFLVNFNGEKWGVAFSHQLVQQALPRFDFDQSVQWIVTEKEVIQT